MRLLFLFSLSVFLAAALAGGQAHALTVKNLSDSTHVIVIERGGNMQEIVLPPKASRHFTGGDMVLHMPGQRPIQAEFLNEYAIWPDGKLIIQRRQKIKGMSR